MGAGPVYYGFALSKRVFSTVVHSWRRPILHVTAFATVLASGGAGVLLTQPRAEPVLESEPIVAEAAPAMLEIPPVPVPVVELPDAPITSQPPADEVPVTTRRYVVEPGDTVRSIALKFGVTNETIVWENDLSDPDFLAIGQELHILPFSGLIHEVRPGDTVASVANGYDAKIQDVIKANKLNEPYIIVVGQKLAVPGGYRALPQKVVVAPANTVEAPPEQVAAAISAPVRSMPVLGNTPQERFIASIGEAAVVSHDRTGVPASVTIAQAILETYWGSSRLAREANNYFGIKAQTRSGNAGVIWLDVWEVIGGRNVMQSQSFRAYDSIAESFVDHGRFFVENGRYAAAMAARGDPRQFAREVNRAGYATDPAYAGKLIALMDRYNLYRFDDV